MPEYPLVTVGGLVIAPDGDLLLVRSKKWLDLYSLPGGKVEWGETREEAFRREVWEETHLKLAHVQFALVQDCVFSPDFWRKSHFVMNDFIADLHPNYRKEDVILNDEAYEYKWVKPEEALTLPLHRECAYLIRWYKKSEHRRDQQARGIIGVCHHQIRCIVGVNPEERIQEQEIYVDLKVKSNFNACLGSDQIKDTVDYNQLAQLSTQLAQEKRYHLLETFAVEVIDQILANFPVSWAWIRVKKPLAISTAHYTLVEFERSRQGVD